MVDERIEVIDKIYAAILEPALWDQALTALARASGGVGACLLAYEENRPTFLATQSLAEANAAYAKQGWFEIDSLVRAGARLPDPTGVVTDRRLLTAEQRRSDPFLNEFWRAHGITGMASRLLQTAPGTFMTLAVQRGQAPDYFCEEELQALASCSRTPSGLLQFR